MMDVCSFIIKNNNKDSNTVVGVHTRVGDHNKDAVGTVFDNLWDDGLEDVDVPLHQVEAALPLLLTDPGCHYHQAGVSCHCVVWEEEHNSQFSHEKKLSKFYLHRYCLNL